jgi:hypothetical protein
MLRIQIDVLASDTSREEPASRSYTYFSKFHVPPTMIRPLLRTTVSNQRERKSRRSEFLSSSTYKNSLKEKLREKATEDGEKKGKCKRTAVRRK